MEDKAGRVETKTPKVWIFTKFVERGQWGGLSEKQAKSSTVGAFCENCEGFFQTGQNLKNTTGPVVSKK